ncbi:cAMP-dependent protein kinase catalytic subunit-like, partial [Polistes fuscatus]|uniref:cAMP-dependent protein kinase catalytic subunit-like n=1 Tax=Polistes fuscatus TaxID=30207 RepID=UPI001CA8EEF4
MLSYMLPTEDKPPPGEPNQNHQKTQGNYRNTSSSRLHKNPRDQYQQQQQQQHLQQQQQIQNHHQQQLPQTIRQKTTASTIAISTSPKKFVDGSIRTMIVSNKIEDQHQHQNQQQQPSSMDRHYQTQFQHQHQQQQQQHQIQHSLSSESPKHNGTLVAKKSTLHNSSRVTKDDSLYSIDSDASTVGSDRKNKILNGAKHASLKRVSFGSSKGSMVETLVYETPVQEEPEINHFLDHNGRLPPPMIPVPDTDEGREKVRVSLLGPQPSPATPGVLLLEPIIPSIGHPIEMAASPAELLTTHSEHTTPAYHTQISTDSGWDN